MTRVRLIDAKEQLTDEKMQWNLRPASLKEYTGQEKLKTKLQIALDAAKKRGEPLDHILLYGPPGLGKTTLAYIISSEMNTKIICSSGPAIERSGDLMGILSNLQAGDVFFIDEMHRLPRAVEEFLYSAMEDFKIDFVVDKGVFAKTIKVTLQHFTLVGATTRAGLIAAPLRERFGLVHHLDFYPPGELKEILCRSSAILQINIEQEAAMEIARRSRGTPRIANRLLKRVRDFAEVKADGLITLPVVEGSLSLEGIDGMGLDELDRHYLKTIVDVYQGGPVGIEALSATLNEEADTLQDVVEPFLLKCGFVSRTPSGRKATELARRHLSSQTSLF